MKKRLFGKEKIEVSEIGLGTWQLGAVWGDEFDETEAFKILEKAEESGITFIDTAGVYNNGLSEKAIGEYVKDKREKFYIVTKVGRRLNPHTADMYNSENIERLVYESLDRMKLDYIDCVLLHCPPTEVYKKDEVFLKLEELKKLGKIKSYGVSVEKVEEALMAMKYDISAIEVIFNMFRLKPIEELFEKAKENNIGIIARVPLASGLLTGKFNKTTTFGPNDHRTYNRDGKAFDKGETFSGVDFELGLKATEELKKVFNTENLTPYAIKWCLMFDSVSVVIPGCSKVGQVDANVYASSLDDLTDEQMQKVEEIYNKYIRKSVHNNW